MNSKLSKVLYDRHEYLADVYSRKVWGYEKLGITRDDIVQEMKAKIWRSVELWWKKMIKYYKTNREKPTPLEFYIRSALANHIKDVSKSVTRNNSLFDKVDNVDISCWSGEESVLTNINDFKINGIDLLHGLSPCEKVLYRLYLKGNSMTKIVEKYKGVRREDLKILVEKQRDFLEVYKDDLYNQNVSFLQVY